MSHAVSYMYSFFNDFKTYKSYDDHIETEFKSGERKNLYHYFSPDVQISNNESANEICEKFKCLYELIISVNKNTNSLYNNDLAYLNYWLNGKLRNNTFKHDIMVNDFYEKMSSRDIEFLSSKLDKNLYNIEEHDFQNMKLLDYLYVKHGEIYAKMVKIMDQEKLSCLEHFQNLMDNYKKGIIQCHIDNSNFCKALKDFKGEYEKITGPESVSEKCVDRELLQLPTYNDALLEYKNINVVGSVLGPSFATLFTSVFLYMFTPLGQRIRAIMGRNNGIHSDLYEENNESFLSSSDNDHINVDENSYHIKV
ncbi:PIR Superfamily Protein [Plasmodium ovale wallikeri]|uniref:PIR Superfamily Protein n=1 Tax=Plasmodium ovale wallikeri TaxID=864142 RepID=A0A1A9AHD1_PLAOA|nr:PIR Superfamily Protein [Plasmodium ovale wallikeri]